MEKVEIQITKGLTEETTEEITLLGHILENADGLKVFSELINHVISENAESILLEKKKLLAILQVEEDDLDEMMKKIIEDIIRSQIEIIEKEHKKTGFKIVSIFEMVTYDPDEGLTIQVTRAVKPYLKNLIEIIYVFLTIFLYLPKCPQSLILSALRAFCFCGKPRISRSIFLYFPCQSWLKSW